MRLIATNTIAQGDTREVGLDHIHQQGSKIYRATNYVLKIVGNFTSNIGGIMEKSAQHSRWVDTWGFVGADGGGGGGGG